jgi:hypothetical protein
MGDTLTDTFSGDDQLAAASQAVLNTHSPS